MKKLLPLLLLSLTALRVDAQAPQAFTYQAVARDADGDALMSAAIDVQFHLHQGTAAGPVVFAEAHSTTTNAHGLFSLEVGNGTASVGDLATVDWSDGPYFMEVLMDIGGTGSLTSVGTQQLLSVPYALHAGRSSNVPDGTEVGQLMHWDGAAWVADSGLYVHEKRFGIGTNEPPAPLSIESREILKTYFQTGDIPTQNDFAFHLTDSTGFSIEQGTPATSTSRLFIQQSTGNVGLGTTSPEQRLHVVGAQDGGPVGLLMMNTAASSTDGWSLAVMDDNAVTARNKTFAIQEKNGSTLTERITLLPGGNLGVNEQLPYATLHVSRPLADPSQAISLSENTGIAMIGPVEQHLVMDSEGLQARHLLAGGTSMTGTAGSLHLQRLGGDVLVHGDDASHASQVIIKGNGNVGIGTPDPFAPLHIVSRDHLVAKFENGDIPTQDDMRITTQGGTGFSIDDASSGVGLSRIFIQPATGHIGLGTTAPQEKLHVNGAIIVGNTSNAEPAAGTIRFNGSDFEGRTASGDWVIFNGSVWQKVDNTEGVFVLSPPDSRVGINEPAPDATLHVARPASDPDTGTQLDAGSGIANFGDLIDSMLNLSEDGLQARVPAPPGSPHPFEPSALNLQPMGGRIVIHGGATTDDGKVVVTHTGSVGIGHAAPSARLHVRDSDASAGSTVAASIESSASTSSTTGTRVALGIATSGVWSSDPQSKNIGLHVSEVSGQANANANLAAVLNGNVVVGSLNAGDQVGAGGTNVLAIQNGTAPASIGAGLTTDDGVQLYVTTDALGVSTLHIMDGSGHVMDLHVQNPLSTADMTQVNPIYDGSTAAVINNMRTRINELEAKLQALGLLH